MSEQQVIKEAEVVEDHKFKKSVLDIVHRIQSMGFWILIIVVSGFYLGTIHSTRSVGTMLDNSITLGGFIHKGKVFDIKERIVPANLVK
jgi:hypothetical protein